MLLTLCQNSVYKQCFRTSKTYAFLRFQILLEIQPATTLRRLKMLYFPIRFDNLSHRHLLFNWKLQKLLLSLKYSSYPSGNALPRNPGNRGSDTLCETPIMYTQTTTKIESYFAVIIISFLITDTGL